MTTKKQPYTKGMNAAAQKELDRLIDVTSSIDVSRAAVLYPMLQNLAWMKCKLDDTRELLDKTAVLMKYENGGGQSGVRKNPGYEAYNAMFRQFSVATCKVCAMIPDEGGKSELAEWLAAQD